MPNVFDFIPQVSKPNIINLQSEKLKAKKERADQLNQGEKAEGKIKWEVVTSGI